MRVLFLIYFTLVISSALTVFSAFAAPFQKPLIVDARYLKEHGRVITGNFSGTLTQAAISITTDIPVIIRDSNLQGPGDLIYISSGDVTVENTTGTASNPNLAGAQKGSFINANYVRNLVVKDCTVKGTRYGIYVNGYTGNKTSRQVISILRNSFSNIDGRPSDGNNGYITSGNFIAAGIQLNEVAQVPNIELAWNQIINQPGQSQSNDHINIYDSSGTSSSPILIHHNYLQGAYPANPGIDKGYYGGGISLDGNTRDTAATTTAFTKVYYNHIVGTANYGLQIKAGHDNEVYRNRVLSSGRLTNGTLYAMKAAIGLNNVNFYQQTADIFFNNTFHNNVVGLVTTDANGNPIRADMKLPGQNNAVDGNIPYLPNDNAHPSITDEGKEYALWQKTFQQLKAVGWGLILIHQP